MKLGSVYTIGTPYGEISIVLFHKWGDDEFIVAPVTRLKPLRGEIPLSTEPALSAGLWGAGSMCNEVIAALGSETSSVPERLVTVIDECWKGVTGFLSTFDEAELARLVDFAKYEEAPEEKVRQALCWLMTMDMRYVDGDISIEELLKKVSK